MSKEAMRLAIEVFGGGNWHDEIVDADWADKANNAIKVLQEALAEQPAPMQSWKLVPFEPTEDMWKAVNKLDDEMASGSYDGKGCSIEQAWDCLLAAAPQPAQQEPVAWMHPDWPDGYSGFQSPVSTYMTNGWIPLYTTPPAAQRQWVGLTDEEQIQVAWSCGAMSADWLEFARAIEAKLKEKNT